MICVIDDCERPHSARGWCTLHYQRWQHHGHTDLSRPEERRRWINPLVCDCETPDADPKVNAGMCSTCKRKPLELMAVKS